MATIAANTRIRFIVIGRCETALTTFSEDVRAKVQSILSAKGWRVYSSLVQVTSSSLVPGVRVERLGDWDYRAEIETSSPTAHASIEDVISVVNGAFWSACDSQPTTSARGYTTQSEPRPPSAPPSVPWWAIGILALVAVTATGVFVAKRG